ncbi:MAG TPA: hypothetical protein VMP89_00525 [Solirubrobacteraceae bacterium]|nr:hypothetical protein [Solirubrobacteraceae bacterium]
MDREENLVELIRREPDERLLSEHLEQLPESVGRPETIPTSPVRRKLVGTGATLTGVTLILGIALIAAGIVEAIAGSAGVAIAALVLGVVLAGTHWGWVHVAEITANSIEERRNSSVVQRRREWLRSIEPYGRYEVSSHAGQDGSITIETVRYRPVPDRERSFTFTREVVGREVHSGEEPAATVAERAELLRRQAAADTAVERERYEVANDAYQGALMAHEDEQERIAAVRAASEALSERINSHLRDPPLTE